MLMKTRNIIINISDITSDGPDAYGGVQSPIRCGVRQFRGIINERGERD